MTLLATFVFASFLFCTNVQAETKSDLVVNNIEVSSNNGRHKITATIKNIGAATASLATDLVLTYGTNIQEIASCTIGHCLIGDTYNASIRANWLGKNTLAPDEEYDVIFDNSTYLLDRVEFTNGANYSIRTIIDNEQSIDESNEINNSSYKDFALDSAADLIINNIKVSSNNNQNKITVTIKNIGSNATTLSARLALTYGTNVSEISSCTIGHCLIGDTYNAGINASWLGKNTLAPDEEYDIIFDRSTYGLDQVEFTNGANYLIKAIIDDEQTIDESDENNNIYSIFHNTIITSNHKLIKYPNDSKVYLVENNKKRWITSGDVFNAKKFRWDFIETISTSNVYDDGENLNSSVSEGDLIKYENDPKVYLVENNKKRWITSGDVFNTKGYSWSQIRILASTEADLENGTNISN